MTDTPVESTDTESEANAQETAAPAVETSPVAQDHPVVVGFKAKVQALQEEINAWINAEETKIATHLNDAKQFLEAAVESVKKHF